MNLISVCAVIALLPPASTELAQLWRWFPQVADDYTSIVAGDLTGEGVEDVAYLADGSLRVVRGIAWYHDTQGQVFEEIVQAGLTDVALLADAGDGGSDALVVVSAQDLRVLRHAGGSWNALDDVSIGDLEHVAAWNDGGSVSWIAATAADGWVHRFTYDAELSEIEAVSSAFYIGSGAVLDVLLFNRDDDGEPEIAIARDSGLLLHAWDGSHLGTVLVYPFGSGVKAAVLPTADHSEERLALVTRELGSPTNHWLRVLFDEEGTLVLGAPIDIGADQPLCLASGDWTADGEPDLAVSSISPSPSFFPSLRVFENLGGDFSAEQMENLNLPEGPSIDELHALVLADLDHDGDADGFFVDPALDGALLHRSDANDSQAWAPALDEGLDPEDGVLEHGLFSFHYEIVAGSYVAEVPSDANEIEIVVYHADEPGVPIGTVATSVSLTTPPNSYPVTLYAPLSVPEHPFDGAVTKHDWVLEAHYRRNVGGEPVFDYPTRFGKLHLTATWGDGTPSFGEPGAPGALAAPVPGQGGPQLRGQLDPLDDIPPYVGTPQNP